MGRITDTNVFPNYHLSEVLLHKDELYVSSLNVCLLIFIIYNPEVSECIITVEGSIKS